MKVFKFGGASVKDAEAVRNIGNILSSYRNLSLVVVISAMGKTTNALEQLIESYFNENNETPALLAAIKKYHYDIMHQLFKDKRHPVFTEINNLFVEIEWILEEKPQESFNYLYDQIVSVGELLSTRIISAYLNDIGITNTWLDARGIIRTDNTYREANVLWEETTRQAKEQISSIIREQIALTQGFIGGTSENTSTTLGREGSDYTAAILASVLDAEEVTVWKDVPGILTADPKIFPTISVKIDEMSYYEASEMTYYGAKVLHPKTIKPLQNKNIPLRVRSFLHPKEAGTVIKKYELLDQHNTLPPIVILKEDQILCSMTTPDLSFITEEHLSQIYGLFARHNIKINVMQTAAVSLSVCIDNKPWKVKPLMHEAAKIFRVKSNENLKLLTIRHYNDSIVNHLTAGKKILLEQRSRHTVQFVFREEG